MEVETKKCSHCQSDIPVNAKKCSHCQADLRNWISRHPVVTAIIIIVVISIFSSAISKSSNVEQVGTIKSEVDQNLTLSDVSTKATEKNSVWWKYSWMFTATNNSNMDKNFNAEIIWKDSEGFVVDDTTEYNLTVLANSQETFSGYDLIDIKVAPNIQDISVKLK